MSATSEVSAEFVLGGEPEIIIEGFKGAIENLKRAVAPGSIGLWDRMEISAEAQDDRSLMQNQVNTWATLRLTVVTP